MAALYLDIRWWLIMFFLLTAQFILIFEPQSCLKISRFWNNTNQNWKELSVGLLSEVNKYLYLIFPLKFKKDGNMQLKFAGIESLILCTIACFQISFTKRPQCSSFAMKFFGSLREDRAKLLWDIEKESLVSVMHACFPRCEKDQRCVGVEVCTIRPDLLRCRGCCEWYVVDKDGGLPRNATDSCKYFELVCEI